MAFSTGFKFFDEDGLVDGGNNFLGNNGTYQTQASIETHIADKKIAMIETNGAEHAFIIPLVSGAAYSSGSADAILQVHGVLGFGESGQSENNKNGRFFFHYGSVGVVDLSGSALPDISDGTNGSGGDAVVLYSPSGREYNKYAAAGGADGGPIHELICGEYGGIGADGSAADMDRTGFVDVNVGFVIAAGIQRFQHIAISYKDGSLDAGSRGNALVSLRY